MDADVIALPITGIVSNPKIRGGKPIIDGTGLRVMDVAAQVRFHQQSPQQIAEGFGITIAQVHAALAYYFAHQVEIDSALDLEERLIREAEEKGVGQPNSPVSR